VLVAIEETNFTHKTGSFKISRWKRHLQLLLDEMGLDEMGLDEMGINLTPHTMVLLMALHAL